MQPYFWEILVRIGLEERNHTTGLASIAENQRERGGSMHIFWESEVQSLRLLLDDFSVGTEKADLPDSLQPSLELSSSLESIG